MNVQVASEAISNQVSRRRRAAGEVIERGRVADSRTTDTYPPNLCKILKKSTHGMADA